MAVTACGPIPRFDTSCTYSRKSTSRARARSDALVGASSSGLGEPPTGGLTRRRTDRRAARPSGRGTGPCLGPRWASNSARCAVPTASDRTARRVPSRPPRPPFPRVPRLTPSRRPSPRAPPRRHMRERPRCNSRARRDPLRWPSTSALPRCPRLRSRTFECASQHPLLTATDPRPARRACQPRARAAGMARLRSPRARRRATR